MLLNKQNVFDDFAFAVNFFMKIILDLKKLLQSLVVQMEDFCCSYHVTKSRFIKAVIPQVGVLDMLRL